MKTLKQLENTQDKILSRIDKIELNLSNKMMSFVSSFESLSKMLSETYSEVVNLKKTVQTSASGTEITQDFRNKQGLYDRMESHESSNTLKNLSSNNFLPLNYNDEKIN